MGQFLRLKPSKIKPSQDFLKRDTIDFILRCIQNGELNRLPPTPVVRKDSNSNFYVAIDGHNLLAICELLERECEVYLASSAQDLLPNLESNVAITQRNQDLLEKFEECLKESSRVNVSFRDLIVSLDLTVRD